MRPTQMLFKVKHSTSSSSSVDFVRANNAAHAIEVLKQQILTNKGLGGRFGDAPWFKKMIERKVAETDWKNAEVTIAAPKDEAYFRSQEVIDALRLAIEKAKVDSDWQADVPVLDGYIQKIYDHRGNLLAGESKINPDKMLAWLDGLDRTAESYL